MKIDPKKPYNSLPKLPAGIDLTDPELLVKTIETSDAISKLSTQISVGRSRMIASAFHLLTPYSFLKQSQARELRISSLLTRVSILQRSKKYGNLLQPKKKH